MRRCCLRSLVCTAAAAARARAPTIPRRRRPSNEPSGLDTRPVEHDLPGLGPAERRRHDLGRALRRTCRSPRRSRCCRRRATTRAGSSSSRAESCARSPRATPPRAPCTSTSTHAWMGAVRWVCSAWRFTRTSRRTRACSCRTRTRTRAANRAFRRSARWTTARRSTRAPNRSCCASVSLRPITRAATSRSVPMGCCTSASATAAAAATSTAIPATVSG